MRRNSSHIKIILPEDIHWRIAEFLQGRRVFPFIKNDELVCIFFLYLMREDADKSETNKVVGIAKETVKKIDSEINVYMNSPVTMDSNMIRDLYIKRQLQIMVDQLENTGIRYDQMLDDPIILLYCFSQHISYYRQDYFFQIYGPLNDGELLNEMRSLQGAMIMLGFNRNDEKTLPFSHPIIPLYIWLKDHPIRTRS